MSKAMALRQLIQGLLHPFAEFPFLNGHVFSPTDALAERIGQDCTEAAFAAPEGQRIAAAFARFLGDAEAVRALKKEYHRAFEHRLRTVALAADPTDRHGVDRLDAGPLVHPLDAVALGELAARQSGLTAPLQIDASARLRHRLGVLIAGFGFMARAVYLLVRHGRLRVTPRVYQVAAPNFGHMRHWQMVQAAAEETVGWTPDSLVFVLEDKARAHLFRGGPFPTIEPDQLPVPMGAWLRGAVLPGIALAIRLMGAALFHRDPRMVEMAGRALTLAARSLMVRRIAANVRCRWYLDTEDNSSLHHLRGIILRQQGGGVVRWLYTQNESPGVFSSYLGYDLFLSGGPFQWETYCASWYPGLRNVSIGQLRNDRRMNADSSVDAVYRTAIEDRLARGERMAVYFGGNTGVGFERPMLDSFAALLDQMADRPGWFLVIKPKFRDALYRLCAEDARFKALATAGNIITIHYGPDGAEVCPAGWLIDRLTLGLTLPGSVQLEALTGGRVMFAYWPIIQESVSRRLLCESGLFYDDAVRLKDAIGRFAADPDAFSYPVDWLCQGFDPFRDDRAFERLAVALFGDNERLDNRLPGGNDLSAGPAQGVSPMSLSMPHRLLSWALAGSRSLKSVSPDTYLKAAVKIRNELDVVVPVRNRRGEILIYCDSETVRSRAEKMPTREPATLAWVESFQPDEVFWDIGCNIGVFTLYAAACSRARVVAFDPLPFNYAGLSRNLALNGVTDRVQAFCCALSDTTCATTLYIPAVAYTPGGSGSTIGADPRAFGKDYAAEVSQAALQFTVDDFIAQFNVPVPNHLKLDIDGVQDKVIIGARKTLRDPRLKSMMLELPPQADLIARIQHEIAEAGFILDKIAECAPGGGTDMTRVDTNHFYKRAG